jgi:hypothetical protein
MSKKKDTKIEKDISNDKKDPIYYITLKDIEF